MYKSSPTSKLHVGYDDLLTDAGENILVLEEMFIVWSLTHRCQKLDCIAHKLQKQRYRKLLNQQNYEI